MQIFQSLLQAHSALSIIPINSIETAKSLLSPKQMDSKDYISIGAAIISASSFCVAILSWRQKNVETRRTVRSQITDAITKLDAVFAEWDKLHYENAHKKGEPYFVGRRSFLNGQKRFLARQAVFLVEQEPSMTSDFEYNRIADAFSSVGDFAEGNRFYDRAIAAAKTPFYKSISMRAKARSLFEQGEFVAGRTEYNNSINLLTLDTDINRYVVAETYQRWAFVEADNWNWSEAREHLIKSKEIYDSVQSKHRRASGLENLRYVRESVDNQEQRVRSGRSEVNVNSDSIAADDD